MLEAIRSEPSLIARAALSSDRVGSGPDYRSRTELSVKVSILSKLVDFLRSAPTRRSSAGVFVGALSGRSGGRPWQGGLEGVEGLLYLLGSDAAHVADAE